MKFKFTRLNTKFWMVSHPDTNEVGGGRTKFQAIIDLEATAGRKLSSR